MNDAEQSPSRAGTPAEALLARCWLAALAVLTFGYALWLDRRFGWFCLLALPLPLVLEQKRWAAWLRGLMPFACLAWIAIAIYTSRNPALVVLMAAATALYGVALLKRETAARWFVVVLPLLFLVVLNAGFILLDFTPPPWDQARHARSVLRILAFFADPLGNKLAESLLYYDFYPPMTYLVAAPFAAVLGNSYTGIALSVPLFWLPLGYTLIYRWVRRAFRTERAVASTAAFAVMGGFLATGLAKQFMLDLPTLVMIAAYYYALSRSGYLQRRRYVFWAGVVGGLGPLTKQHVVVYIAPLILGAVVRIAAKAWKRPVRTERYLGNLLLHAAGLALVAGPWYLLHMDFVRFELRNVAAMGIAEGDPDPRSFASLVWYVRGICQALTLPVLAVVLFGWVRALRARQWRFLLRVDLAAVLMAYALFTATWNKDLRYSLPFTFLMLPGLVLALRDGSRRLRQGILAGVTLWTALLNVSQVADIRFLRDLSLGPIAIFEKSAYGLHSHPQGPWSVTNTAESYAWFARLYGRWQPHSPAAPLVIRESWKLEDASFNGPIFNSWNWLLYREHLLPAEPGTRWVGSGSKSDSFVEAVRVGETAIEIEPNPSLARVLFLRDSVWPDYYLFGLVRGPDGVSLTWLGEKIQMPSDITVEVLPPSGGADAAPVSSFHFGPGQSERVANFAEERLRLRFRIVHSSATHWRAKLVASFLKNPDWGTTWLVPLSHEFSDGVLNVDLKTPGPIASGAVASPATSP